MVLGSAGIFGGNERSKPSVPVTKPVAHATPVKQTQAQTKAAASPFAPTFKAALHATASSSQKSVITAKGSSGHDRYVPSASLTLVNGLPPLTSPATAPTITTTAPSAASTAQPANTGGATGSATPTILALEAALQQGGVDTTGMQFNEHQDLVTYPGGSYVNDIISLQTATGRTHDYMANLVAIAPPVTVVEIQQLLAGNRG